MARIISFSHTTAALVNGFKSITTRDWKPEYAAQFKAGDEITAYDRSPRNGGKPVARLRLTADVQREDLRNFTRDDFQREGFGFMAATNQLMHCIEQVRPGVTVVGANGSLLRFWRAFQEAELFVVRFEVLELLPGAEQYKRLGVVPVELPEGVA